jgi:hypothetical protein
VCNCVVFGFCHPPYTHTHFIPYRTNFLLNRFPIWSYHSSTHDFYGTPIYGVSGCKVAIDAGGPEVTVEYRSYETDTVREQACINLLRDIIPKVIK